MSLVGPLVTTHRVPLGDDFREATTRSPPLPDPTVEGERERMKKRGTTGQRLQQEEFRHRRPLWNKVKRKRRCRRRETQRRPFQCRNDVAPLPGRLPAGTATPWTTTAAQRKEEMICPVCVRKGGDDLGRVTAHSEAHTQERPKLPDTLTKRGEREGG